MRTAGQIKRELIDLIWRKKLPRIKIAEDSRCSNAQLWQALKLEATETVLRRLDAYLDAKDLHQHVKGSRLLARIENLSYELYHYYDQKSLPIADIALWPLDRQKWLLEKMHWRAKKHLRLRFQREMGADIAFSDGSDYWKSKKKAQARGLPREG